MSEDRCVSCGEIVPEGRVVCQRCEVDEEDIIRRMSNRIRYLEEKIKYHETTIRIIYADAVGEAEDARQREYTSIMVGDTKMGVICREKAAERKRMAERVKSILLRRNFDPEKKP